MVDIADRTGKIREWTLDTGTTWPSSIWTTITKNMLNKAAERFGQRVYKQEIGTSCQSPVPPEDGGHEDSFLQCIC